MPEPFILLDDACDLDGERGAADARLYTAPVELVVARRPGEVEPALERLRKLTGKGLHLAGYLAYEAGLCLEPRLAALAPARIGADGPLLWFGAFEKYETIPAAAMLQWLAENGGAGPASIGPLDPSVSPGGYASAFAAIREAIHAGDIYQANLTLPLTGSWRGDAMALYAAIRPAAKAGYGGVIHDGTHWLLSFSPELFFSIRAGEAKCKPMKGTRPRGASEAEDSALADELARSDKERAENLMIVDLMRNDLSRVAVPGSVRVENAFAVETYPTVHQMVTTVVGQLPPQTGAVDMLRALFPCGSITGAPKIRAMELIGQVERSPRGPYCGSIGRIDANGDAAFNVAIRTLRLSQDRNGGPGGGGTAVLGVGSAVVADSQSMAEWRECLVKGAFLRQSGPDMMAPQFDLIETMAFTPEAGVALLELHLERMKASAAELGFSFDRHGVRNAIQALCFDLDSPARLRLLLARSGATSLEAAPLAEGAMPQPVVCGALPMPVDPGDWRLRHKTSDRWFYDEARAVAENNGANEAILVRHDGLVTEASRANLFVERDGLLLTPPASLGLLPGVLRRSLIEQGRAIEAELTLDDLSGGFLLGNSVRGLMKAELLK